MEWLLYTLTLLMSCKTPPSYSTVLLPLLSPPEITVKTHHLYAIKLIDWDKTTTAQLSTVPTREDAHQVFARHTRFFGNFNYHLKLTVLQVFPIKIKLLGSNLCINYFLGSLRCFWCSQVTVQVDSTSASLSSQNFPKHTYAEVHSFPYINQRPLDSILYQWNWFIKTQYQHFSIRKMHLWH